MKEYLIQFAKDFVTCFITKNRWKVVVKGLGNTILIAFVAVLLGILIGSIVAIVRSTYDNEYSKMEKGLGKSLLSIFNWIFKIYVTVIRGTPVMIQLMIMFYVIFSRAKDGLPVAMLTFGINSGAYVAEIARAGIMSIDRGQKEACEALGLSFKDSMLSVILPQALKNILPSLCNEFISLLKETSVACYVAVVDLTKSGEIIRGATYVSGLPLFVVAALYLLMVVILSKYVGKLEKRLRASDSRN